MIECREHHRIPVELQVFFSTTNQTEIREGALTDAIAAAVSSRTDQRIEIDMELRSGTAGTPGVSAMAVDGQVAHHDSTHWMIRRVAFQAAALALVLLAVLS